MGSAKKQWHLPACCLGETASSALASKPDSSVPPRMFLMFSSCCPSLERVSVRTSLVPLRGTRGPPAALCLTHPPSSLVFTARSYEPWVWGPRLGQGPPAPQRGTSRADVPTSYPPAVSVGPARSSSLPSHHSTGLQASSLWRSSVTVVLLSGWPFAVVPGGGKQAFVCSAILTGRPTLTHF